MSKKHFEVEDLAQFVIARSYRDLSVNAKEQLKIRILDSIGVALGALNAKPVRSIREQIRQFGGNPLCRLIGGGSSAPDRAAFYNGALVRYLDFMDSFLSRGETCHPSDNFAPVLAAAEYKGISGEEFMAALAIAYQVQTRLSEEAPLRDLGFDHVTQGSYAVAAGVSKALNLNIEQTANAIAISGAANNALRITRTGALSHWKGLAYANVSFSSLHATFLAMNGITGPLGIFEGEKGFKQTLSGPFEIHWEKEDLETVTRTLVKKFNAEIHAQSALEAIIDLRNTHSLANKKIRKIVVETFQVAYDIIGRETEKIEIGTKEQADHNFQYMIAIALLDGEVMPRQYTPERIRSRDVQELLTRVNIRPTEKYTQLFPDHIPAKVAVELEEGTHVESEKMDYEGFPTRPFTWEQTEKKFREVAGEFAPDRTLSQIVKSVRELETWPIREFARQLSELHRGHVIKEARTGS